MSCNEGRQPLTFGFDVVGRVATVEFNDFARSAAYDINGLLFVVAINSQGAERRRRDLLGHAPAVAEFNHAFTHEKSQPVFENGHRTRARLPDVWIIVALGFATRLLIACRQATANIPVFQPRRPPTIP